jgi:hypothetical protein
MRIKGRDDGEGVSFPLLRGIFDFEGQWDDPEIFGTGDEIKTFNSQYSASLGIEVGRLVLQQSFCSPPQWNHQAGVSARYSCGGLSLRNQVIQAIYN